jgi:hypothetical protein
LANVFVRVVQPSAHGRHPRQEGPYLMCRTEWHWS